MSENITKTISGQELTRITSERQMFRLNRLTNKIQFQRNITHWEQLICAGYNPQFKRLEAVVNINQAGGYNGGLCSTASQEYVRFFVDFHDGSGFQDMGYTSFKVADISNNPSGEQHPLSYMAYLFIDDGKYRKFLDCDHAVIPKMRAVLSWNSVPSPTNPNEIPHYGNRVDADIQLARKFRMFPAEIAKVLNAPELIKHLDPLTEIELKPQVKISADNLLRVNKAAGIPESRTFYSAIGSKINTTLDFKYAISKFDIESLDKYNIDLSKYIDLYTNLGGKKANTTYEELTCLGLNTDTDSLGAVIHIKKSAGFNGDLCTQGSMEHVAFWADWNNNGTFDKYLGTVSINVHDIKNMPANGLYYNVVLPFDVSGHLKTCDTPNVIKVRAVLSWESLPSTTNPNQLNGWGNYKDALVQLRPATKPGGGIHPVLQKVGNADFGLIDTSHFLYRYQAVAPSIENNRPWGGLTNFRGILDRNDFMGEMKYRFRFKKFGAPNSDYAGVVASVTNELTNSSSIPAVNYSVTQSADAGGWFVYQVDNANHIFSNDENRLAVWNTAGVDDGIYTISFEYKDEFGNEKTAEEFSIIICNKEMKISPTANENVDTNFDLDLVIDGGDCHIYSLDDPKNKGIINGHLRAVHPYFASWSLTIEPSAHTNKEVPAAPGAARINDNSMGRSYSSLGDTGDANSPWSMDTTKIETCGYTISIAAATRVISGGNLGFPQYAPKAVGFSKK